MQGQILQAQIKQAQMVRRTTSKMVSKIARKMVSRTISKTTNKATRKMLTLMVLGAEEE